MNNEDNNLARPCAGWRSYLSAGYLAERRVPQATASGQQALAAYQRIGSRYGAAIAMLNLSMVAQY